MRIENTLVAQVDELIKKGEGVLGTDRLTPNVIGFPTLDSSAFAEWDAQSQNFLTRHLGREHVYVLRFNEKGESGYINTVENGIGILRAYREDLLQDHLDNYRVLHIDRLIENICSRFHLVARQLRLRYQERESLSVKDEYDVQDLLHAILLLYFEDIRPEEWTPSYAGKSSRMDFLLKRELVVIEAKKTRRGLGAKEVSTQLIEDIERYKSHPDCKSLYCFVYDPDGFIVNPRGVEHDLNRDGNPFPVRVFIRPL
jgi:hypothetical protein